MGIKILRTSNGDKLQNTKTGKLAGSVPKKPRIPKVSKIEKRNKVKTLVEDNAYDSLVSKQPWFHSTHEVLAEGTILQTGSTLGVNNFKGEGKVNNRKVWIEPQAHLALGWGSQAARHNGKKIAYIYEVTPSNVPVKKGNRGWITDSAIVIKLAATLPAIPYSLDSSKEAVEGFNKLTKVDSRPKHASKELKGALSNYVSLGEIPDHNARGTQGFRQHQAVIQEIKSNGVFNTVPLYRGAARSPEDEITDRGHVSFLSYTSDRKVAEHFVRFNSGAKLYIAPVGSVKGVQVNDYDYPIPDQAEEYGFSHHDHESEWLVINEAKPAKEEDSKR